MLGLSHLPDTDPRWGWFHDVADKSRSKALLKTFFCRPGSLRLGRCTAVVYRRPSAALLWAGQSACGMKHLAAHAHARTDQSVHLQAIRRSRYRHTIEPPHRFVLRRVVLWNLCTNHRISVLCWDGELLLSLEGVLTDMLGRWSASENTFKHIKQPRAFDQTLQTICQNKTQLESGRN